MSEPTSNLSQELAEMMQRYQKFDPGFLNVPLPKNVPKGKKLADAAEPIAVAEIARFGEALVVPPAMTLDQAEKLIQSRKKYEMEETEITSTFPVFPWDGAAALHRVLSAKYGWAQGVPTKDFFDRKVPPKMMDIAVDVNKTISVPWGAFALPGIDGTIETTHTIDKDVLVFVLKAKVLRKDEPVIRDLFEQVREELKYNSLYRGKAVKISFNDRRGDTKIIPDISFIDTNGIDRSTAVYNEYTTQQLERDLFTPIERTNDLLANNFAIKRGVMLTGTYGTGKTLAATVAASLAVKAGLLYVYVPKSDELPAAIAFARQYQSPAAVVFCEDIDRAVSGNRTQQMDTLLNIVDGVDGKTSNIIIVLTTNDLESINAAMIRPGRLDSIIEIGTPDAQTVTRLVRRYAGSLLADDADLFDVAEVLKGQIPAVIVEVVKRAKLAQLMLQQPGTKVTSLTPEAILAAAETIQNQIEVLRKASTKKSKSKAQVFANLTHELQAYGFPDNDEFDAEAYDYDDGGDDY